MMTSFTMDKATVNWTVEREHMRDLAAQRGARGIAVSRAGGRAVTDRRCRELDALIAVQRTVLLDAPRTMLGRGR